MDPFCQLYFMFVYVMLSCLFFAAGKGLTSWFLVVCVFLSFSHMCMDTHKVRLAPLNMFKSSSILLTFPMWCFFCGSFFLFLFHVCLCCVLCLFFATL